MRKLPIFVLGLMMHVTAFAGAWWTCERDLPATLRNWERKIADARRKVEQLPVQAEKYGAPQAQLAGALSTYGRHLTYAGDSEAARNAHDQFRVLWMGKPFSQPDDAERAAAAGAEDAMQAILAAARDRRIVMLNESHHVSLHRAFGMALAKELRKLGFTHLAVETLAPSGIEDGVVLQSSGVYSCDPAFANFLRSAAADGWRLVPYDYGELGPDDASSGERWNRREAGQAHNLMVNIFDKDPNAKVFVYAGYDHIRKRPLPTGQGTVSMAGILAQRTGLDPLTIDQVEMMHVLDPSWQHPAYANALLKAQRGQPFVLRNARGVGEVFGYQIAGAIDLQVVHPPIEIDAATERPRWMATIAGLRPVEVPRQLLRGRGTRWAYARPQGQPADAVAADIVKLVPGKPAPKFMLPPGEYTYGILK